MNSYIKFKSFFLIVLFSVALPLWPREFPLCLYSVNNPADLKTIQKAGFSCIQTYQKQPETLEALAQEAQKRGLKVVFYSNQLLDTEYSKKAQEWPILAWYLVDEPDVHHWTREKTQQANQITKKAFPGQPTALVIGQGKTTPPFYDIPDIMMMDWYPVPHLPLTSFGDNVRYVKEGLARTHMQGHPVWGVVQAFDWKNFKQFRPDHDRIGRFPTRDEIRFMSYDAILNGASGLFYFTFNHQGKPLPQSAPQYWNRLRQVTQELAQFKKIIELGTEIEMPFTVSQPLHLKAWQYKGHMYAILLNRSGETTSVPSQLQDKRYKLLFKQKKKAALEPYAVWVLKFK